MTQKILLAVDGSEPAGKAVDYVQDAFEPDNYKVIVVTIIPETPDYMANQPDIDDKAIQGQYNRASNDYTEDVVQDLRDAGFEANRTILEGHPGEEICRLSEDKQVDSIVMGRRGLGAVEELLLGSISQFVVHHANCTVSLVPGPE